MSLWLSADELIEITGHSQPAAQVRWFTSRGIRAELRLKPKRRCVVLREWLAAGDARKVEPDWSALHA